MSNNTEHKVIENSNEWINWIEESIAKNHFKFYEYKYFNNIQEIGSGRFGEVYRANWKDTHEYFALKSFFNFNNVIAKEIIDELKLQREVGFHENIIRFCGITTNQEDQNDGQKKYLLVIEYADGGTLKNYLKDHFGNLTWNDKFNMALQLANAVSYLHDNGIVHRDLNSNNILIHQNTIKLANFGSSKRIEDATDLEPNLYNVIPYIDPNQFNIQKDNPIQVYEFNEKSDVYSIGMLLWEISSGQPPFCIRGEQYDNDLAIEILQGLRESPIPDSPEDYVKLYTDCWSIEPDNRSTINQVVVKLKELQSHNFNTDTVSENTNDSLHGDITQLIQNFNEMNTKELESAVSSSKRIMNKPTLSENEFNVLVYKIDDLFNNGSEEMRGQEILNYLNKHKITSQEVYYRLLENQNNSNSVFLLGVFNYLGIEMSINKEKAFELFQKTANLGNAFGISELGYCYQHGFGTIIDKQKAFKLFQDAANLGHTNGIYNLGYCYQYGIGTSVDDQKALELYQMAVNLGHATGISQLGFCYQLGVGTDVDNQKAFELYQKAANLGNSTAQYNLAFMYENGEGIVKDIDQSIYWYEKSAKQGDQDAQGELEDLLDIKEWFM